MDNNFQVKQIGKVMINIQDCCLQIDQPYRAAMAGLNEFTYLQILWWFSGCDDAVSRANLTENRPYVKGPDVLGSFATRSPKRPNPIGLTCACVTSVDQENGIIRLAYLDAFDGSPVLDIKPYTPSIDRVEKPGSPKWCAHWPKNVESSGDFDWQAEFNI